MAVEQKRSETGQTDIEVIFQHTDSELVELSKVADEFRICAGQILRSHRATYEFIKASNEKMQRLNDMREDIFAQMLKTESSARVSKYYIKFREELGRLNVPVEQIHELFVKLMNLSLSEEDKPSAIDQIYARYSRTRGGHNDITAAIYIELFKDWEIPAWFKGNRDNWILFLITHAAIVSYIGDHNSDSRIWMVKIRELPDWYDLSKPADLSNVNAEKDEDERRLEEHGKFAESMLRQGEILARTSQKKIEQSSKWEIEKLSQARAKASNLPSFLFYLKNIMPVLNEKYSNFPEESLRGLNNLSKKMVQDTLGFQIDLYCEYNLFLSSREIFCLWLYASLKEAGIINNGQDIVNGRFSEILEKVINKDANKEWWTRYKNLDKKSHAILFYDMAGIFISKDPVVKDYLLGLLQETNGNGIHPFISGCYDVFVSNRTRLNNIQSEEGARVEIVIKDLKRFTKKWLKENWEQAADIIMNNIKNPKSDLIDVPVMDLGNDQNLFAKEVEQNTEELKKHILDGWTVVYIIDPDNMDNPKYKVQIQGLDSDERCDILANFMNTNNLSHANKAGSIIRAIENYVSAILNGDAIRDMPYNRFGRRFTKIKRDNIRILCQTDIGQRTLQFFCMHRGDPRYLEGRN